MIPSTLGQQASANPSKDNTEVMATALYDQNLTFCTGEYNINYGWWMWVVYSHIIVNSCRFTCHPGWKKTKLVWCAKTISNKQTSQNEKINGIWKHMTLCSVHSQTLSFVANWFWKKDSCTTLSCSGVVDPPTGLWLEGGFSLSLIFLILWKLGYLLLNLVTVKFISIANISQ